MNRREFFARVLGGAAAIYLVPKPKISTVDVGAWLKRVYFQDFAAVEFREEPPRVTAHPALSLMRDKARRLPAGLDGRRLRGARL